MSEIFNQIFNIREAAGKQHLWTFDKRLWGQCPHVIQLSPGGLRNLNVAEHRLKMTTELDSQSKHWHCWVIDDCCHAVEKLVTGDRRLKVLETATEVGISYDRVLNILHEHLGLSKVRARWVPCFLTPVQKSFRVETCSELLAIYSAT